MKHKVNTVVAFIILVVVIAGLMGFKTNNEKTINDFKLQNVDGSIISLKNFPAAKGFIIVFTCNHCPFAKLYPKRLNELNKKYSIQGVPLLAISSTDTLLYEEDTFDKMVIKAKKEKFKFPYLFDGTQEVAKNFAADKTPHAFVIWRINNQWVVKYNGAIDDNGMEPAKVQKHFVADAVEELLAGRAVTVKETKSVGCQIHFRK